jgi:hypothetical protein
MTGFYVKPASVAQILGAFMVPGKPVANMMFTLFASNSGMLKNTALLI